MKQLWFEFDYQKLNDPDSNSNYNETKQDPCKVLDARQVFEKKRNSRLAKINDRIALLSEKWWRRTPN